MCCSCKWQLQVYWQYLENPSVFNDCQKRQILEFWARQYFRDRMQHLRLSWKGAHYQLQLLLPSWAPGDTHFIWRWEVLEYSWDVAFYPTDRLKDFSSKVKCIILAEKFSVLQNLLLGGCCRHGMSKQLNIDGFALSETKVLEFHMSLWFFKGKWSYLPCGYHILLCASIVLHKDGWQPGQFFMTGFDSFLCSALYLKFK